MTTERAAFSAAEHMPDEQRLRALLVGRKVERVDVSQEAPEQYSSGPTGYLHLSDGTVLKVWGNDGGCACTAGCYPLTRLDAVDNVITNVEIEAQPDSDDGDPCRVCGEKWCYEHAGWYRVYVFTGHDRTALASFEGTDGNGYYGTGWWLSVADASGDTPAGGAS